MNPSPKEAGPTEEHIWERGWEGHELEQMRRLARLSMPEKIAWLEEAHRMVRQMAEREKPKPVSEP